MRVDIDFGPHLPAGQRFSIASRHARGFVAGGEGENGSAPYDAAPSKLANESKKPNGRCD